ncbi:MAG: DUF389 domain-containing protein [Aureispira sp.]|nr:DUF389 domain-containing protein [Aureispira sp.]
MEENNNDLNETPEIKEEVHHRPTIKELFDKVIEEAKELFSLHLDTDEAGTIESIKKSIDFRGGNLWSLIFACLIASIGLNNNSTAVIIGAMLISPLMGPIVGVGYSIGTNDFETLKHSFRNLGLSVVVSVVAAMIYFWLSPLKELTPELEARTYPSVYDVLIAVFGGAVGIVASSRKDRGNAVPGVAIATALMPPLCTIGYGLATGNWMFAAGAAYLFFINSVFIAFTAALFVRSLHFPKKQFLDHAREQRVKLMIGVIVVLTVIPSLITAYNVVQEAVFISRAKQFVAQKFKFTQSTVVQEKYQYGSDTSYIDVTLLGKPLDRATQVSIRSDMATSAYNLYNTQLIIHQNDDIYAQLRNSQQQNKGLDVSMIEDILDEKRAIILNKDHLIGKLTEEIDRLREHEITVHAQSRPVDKISKKLTVLFPEVGQFGYNEVIKANFDSAGMYLDTIPTAIIQWNSRKFRSSDQLRIQNYLKLEMNLDTLELVTYKRK